GPNGAGKTTTLRMILNLVRPTAGTATIGGQRYADLRNPIRHVGAVLEASSAHKGRTGRNHLRIICMSAGIPLARADEVLEIVGLTPAAKRKFKGYSLGMRQRLGIAAALTVDGTTVTTNGDGALLVTGVDAPAVGAAAFKAGVELHELVAERPDLEDVFLELTKGKAAIR